MFGQVVTSLAPERFLALGISVLLVWGSVVAVTPSAYPRVGWTISSLSVGVLFIVVLRLAQSRNLSTSTSTEITSGFYSTLSIYSAISSDFRSHSLKILRVLATRLCLIVVSGNNNNNRPNANVGSVEAAFEYPLLRLLALLGRRFLVSAEDLRVFYLALELQSLSLYVLAASLRGSAYSTEAGLKYFRLGAFASGLFLLGASLVYGYLGSTSYDIIGQLLSVGPGTGPSVSSSIPSSSLSGVGFGQVEAGFALRVVAIRFKLAAAPFHRWSPDVIEGSPTTSARFFASVTKVAALGALIRLCYGPFYGLWIDRLGNIVVRSALSRGIAAVAALGQRRRKRFLAYSAIGHRGFRLRGLACGTIEGVQSTRRYLVIYVISSLGRWSAVVASGVQYFTDLGGLAQRQPALAAVFAVSRFSRAGVPPRAGFLAKLSVFFAARESSRVNSRYRLARFAVLASVVGAFYYLRIIKIRYFEGTGTGGLSANLAIPVTISVISTGAAWVRSITTFIIVFLLFNPTLLSVVIQRATLSRFAI